MTDTTELRKLEQAATPGPWSYSFSGYSINIFQSGGQHIATLHWGEPSLLHKQRENDAFFIVAARNALPALLDELDRLREERDRLLKAARWFACNPPGTPVPDEFDGVLDQTGSR